MSAIVRTSLPLQFSEFWATQRAPRSRGLIWWPPVTAGNDLVDGFGLAGVAGDSYSLVEMQSGPSANNLAFIEYDLALINSDPVRISLLRNFCPRCLTFFVNRIRSPTASVISSRSNTLNPWSDCLLS
jgi:hypothetical protein